MKTLLPFLVFLFMTTFCFADVDCIWERKSNTITVKYVTSCDSDYRQFESFFNKISADLKKMKLSFKVLLLVNEARIGNEHNNRFASISYDTLASLDDDYIFNFYYSTLQRQIQERNVSDSYKLYDTLDINATLSRQVRKIGLKLILNANFTDVNWQQLEKFVLFGVANVETIKNEQRRIKIRYYANGYWVSMLSYDTTRINSFLGWLGVLTSTETKSVKTEINKRSMNYKNLLWICSITLITILFSAVLVKKYNR